MEKQSDHIKAPISFYSHGTLRGLRTESIQLAMSHHNGTVKDICLISRIPQLASGVARHNKKFTPNK